MYSIFCDSLQEGNWFKSLNAHLVNAPLIVIPSSQSEQQRLNVDRVLLYDRPDIILQDDQHVIFVLERTKEVPSGHNVGQRFGRLLAAAKERIPVVYFGPYVAYKHGGKTAGPRYMNLRLFYSLFNVSACYHTAVTTIDWPVDERCEVLLTSAKDDRMREYMTLFFDYYDRNGSDGLTEYIANSDYQRAQYKEQKQFAADRVLKPEQYDVPPESLEIVAATSFVQQHGALPVKLQDASKVVLYRIGMTYIRSDPYAGMAALYKYLYGGGQSTVQVLYFPYIDSSLWYRQARSSKTYRMYKEFAEAILFSDAIVEQSRL